MTFIGIDLHKKTITLGAVDQDRTILKRQTLSCAEPDRIRDFVADLVPFQAVVEATASYEWLWQILEPLADRLVLAHPKKLRVIAESTRKNDKLDAHVLAIFLALEMIPEAYRPTPRQRQHRALVRLRYYLRQQVTRTKNKIRRVVSDDNADRTDLFEADGQTYLEELAVSAADRVVLEQLRATWRHHEEQLQAVDQQLRAFARQAPLVEQEARAVLASIPEVGAVTVDVVRSALGDIRRFRSAKQVAAYAGLAPRLRASAGHRQELGITKEGSRLWRWVLVEASWRLVRRSRRWGAIVEGIAKRRGKKKAVVAVARRRLGVMFTLRKTGQRYRPAA